MSADATLEIRMIQHLELVHAGGGGVVPTSSPHPPCTLILYILAPLRCTFNPLNLSPIKLYSKCIYGFQLQRPRALWGTTEFETLKVVVV